MKYIKDVKSNIYEKKEHVIKIGLITPFFLPQIGGANRYCYELAKALSSKGYEVHLFTRKGALEDKDYFSHPVLTFDLANDLRKLKKYDMDIWHSLFFYYAPLSLYKRNVFITGHGDDCFSFRIRFNLPGKKFLEKHLLWRLNGRSRKKSNILLSKCETAMNYYIRYISLLRARHIITVSNYTKSMLSKKYPVSGNKITVLPPGVSERFFKNENKPSDRKNIFLTVSRLDENDRIKNIHGAINALSELKNEYDFKYIIIGGTEHGTYRKELEDLITEKNVGDKITIEGRKTDDELEEYYRTADLFILVSYAEPDNFEGFGIVFLEANASGTPVLTSREGGMADYVQEGVNGYYVRDISSEGIRAALKQYLDGGIKFDRKKMRELPEKFRWTHIADRVLKVYFDHAMPDSY